MALVEPKANPSETKSSTTVKRGKEIMTERLKLLSEEKADMKRMYQSSDGIYTSFKDYWNDYMELMKGDGRIVTINKTKYIKVYD